MILQPFGCLPNHIIGRGICKRLKELYPDVQILPLDYDPDVSFANIENRLQMLIMNAGKESVKNQKIMLCRPRTEIIKDNCHILQLLDLLKDIEQYVDEDMEQATRRIYQYVKQLDLTQKEVDQYIGFYPDRIYKNIYDMKLYKAFVGR